MAVANVTLFVNVTRGVLQASTTDGTAVDANYAFTVGDTYDLRLAFIEQVGRGPAAVYSILTPSSLGLKVGLGIDGTAYALQTSFSASGNYLEGSLDCNVSAFETAVNAGTTISLEIELSEGGKFKTVYKKAVTCRKGVITTGATTPLPADSYYTKAEIDAMVAFLSNSAGKTITLTSPDGTRQRIIGVRDDGSTQDDVI